MLHLVLNRVPGISRRLATIIPCLCLLVRLAAGDGGDSEFFQDFDNTPGAHYEFKVDVAAAGEECFFQKLKAGSTLTVGFEVLRGADRNINFSITHPTRGFIDHQPWTTNGHSETKVEDEAVYSVCVDNKFSRFSKKLVYLFIDVFVPSEWHEYAQQTQQFDVSVESLQTAVDKYRRQMSKVLRELGMIRFMGARDQYRVEMNGEAVKRWSLVMIAVILISAGVQVYFVRSLFKTVNVTPTSKPRA